MKKWKLVLLIVAAALTVAGMLIASVGFFALGGDFSRLNGAKYVTNTHTASGEFNRISIDTYICDVRLAVSADGSCYVESTDTEKLYTDVIIEDNTLIVKRIDDRRWYDCIGIFWGEVYLTVYLPQAKYEKLTVDTATGDVVLPSSLEFDSVDISVNTGSVEIYSKIVETLSVENDTGDVSVKGIAPKKVEIEAETGDIELSDIKCDTLELEATTGEIDIESVICSGDMNIRSATGDIELERCDGENIYIESDTGDISGTLLSDKMFSAASDTGNVRVPEPAEGGKCRIQSDTGNIEIRIVK